MLQQAYFPNDQSASPTDADGSATSFSYDGFDRLSTITYPGGSTEAFTYHDDNIVLTRKTRAGATIAFTYDTLNRLSSKTPPAPDAVATYGYDLVGRQRQREQSSDRRGDAAVRAIGALCHQHCLRQPTGRRQSRGTAVIPRATNLGCADNDLVALRRQCFYLALHSTLVSVRFSHVFRECLVVPYWIFLQHGESLVGRKQYENRPRRTWWSVHIEAWRRSGLSRRSYCRQHRLDQGTFARWLSVLVDAEALGVQAELKREERRLRRPLKLSSDTRSRAVQAFWAMHGVCAALPRNTAIIIRSTPGQTRLPHRAPRSGCLHHLGTAGCG